MCWEMSCFLLYYAYYLQRRLQFCYISIYLEKLYTQQDLLSTVLKYALINHESILEVFNQIPAKNYSLCYYSFYMYNSFISHTSFLQTTYVRN